MRDLARSYSPQSATLSLKSETIMMPQIYDEDEIIS